MVPSVLKFESSVEVPDEEADGNAPLEKDEDEQYLIDLA